MEIPPPAELHDFVQVFGAEGTLQLIEAYGGTRLWVPKMFDTTQPTIVRLTEEFGAPTVRAMVERWGNDYLKVPSIKWWRARLYHARGMDYRQIARALGCDMTTVWRHLHPRARADQLSLPI